MAGFAVAVGGTGVAVAGLTVAVGATGVVVGDVPLAGMLTSAALAVVKVFSAAEVSVHVPAVSTPS